MIFQDFVSKITAFVKKTPTFSRIQKLLSNCKPSSSGTYILKWFVFSNRLTWNCSRVFLQGILSKIFKNYHKNIFFGALFGFDWHWFYFETSVTHIFLLFCVVQVKILLIYEIRGYKKWPNWQKKWQKTTKNAIWGLFLRQMRFHL